MAINRTLFLIVTIFIVFVLLIARLIDIQVVKSEEYKYFAQRQQTKLEKISPERGLIYDRDNTLLVYNRNDVSFFLDLRMATKADKERIAEKFSEVFGKSKEHYFKLMDDTGKTICIERKAPANKAFELAGFKANGLFSTDDPTRLYQYEHIGGQLLGYLNSDYSGVAGMEKSFDKYLRGEEGVRLVQRNAVGDMITIAEQETRQAVPGFNVHLTINKTYQTILEEELNNGLAVYGGTSAIGIVMDPNTGEILAIANSGEFDPNRFWEYSDFIRRDKSITDTYEPGSTFKGITLAALLDQKLCEEDDPVFAENGKYKFKNVFISDTRQHQWLTVKSVLEQSSNIGMSKLSQKINNDIFYKYLRAFGFGNYTSYGLPGEAKGYLKKPNEWSGITKAFLSFGYEISVTPLQMALAYSAIINGGILFKPQIVKKLSRKNGSDEINFEPKEIRRVLSTTTSERMRKLLSGVIENGTGKNAATGIVTVGGKTGTSQKLIGGNYSKAEYNSSFIGYFPADKPRVLCFVLVNSPTIGRYGSLVAAPIFRNITERIVNTNPGYFRHDPEIEQDIYSKDVNIVFSKDDKPHEPGSIKQAINHESFTTNKMPDLKNHSMRDAIVLLTRLGIKYSVTGSGKVVSQSIAPGSKLKPGMVCKLECKELVVTEAAVY